MDIFQFLLLALTIAALIVLISRVWVIMHSFRTMELTEEMWIDLGSAIIALLLFALLFGISCISCESTPELVVGADVIPSSEVFGF